MKPNRCLVVLVIATLIALQACKPKPAAEQPKPKVLSPNFTTQDIGNLLYGTNYNTEKEEWSWVNRDSSLYMAEMSASDSLFIGQINLIDTFTIKGNPHLVVVANEFPNVKCDACSPAICMYLFASTDTGWVLTQKRLIDFIGSLYNPPTAEAIDLGKEVYGYKFEPVYNDQGYTSGTLQMYMYKDENITDVLKVTEAYQNNSGSFEASEGKEFEYNTYIVTTDTTKPVYNIALVREGTYIDINKGIDVDDISDTVNYTFNGTKYVPVSEVAVQ
jgi:hypothetical protein